MKRRMMALEQWPCSKDLLFAHWELLTECQGLRCLHCERYLFCMNEWLPRFLTVSQLRTDRALALLQRVSRKLCKAASQVF